MAWERVYTVNNFWDSPRLGVADVFGRPHVYESPFSELKDDFEDFFLVSPIDPELLTIVMEDWEIWIRWSAAFDRGEVSQETHPALPSDRPRHDELTNLIGNRLKINPTDCEKLHAEFRSVQKGWNGMEVQWSRTEGAKTD